MICLGIMKGNTESEYRHQGEVVLQGMKSILYDDVAHLILKYTEDKMYLCQRISIFNP